MVKTPIQTILPNLHADPASAKVFLRNVNTLSSAAGKTFEKWRRYSSSEEECFNQVLSDVKSILYHKFKGAAINEDVVSFLKNYISLVISVGKNQNGFFVIKRRNLLMSAKAFPVDIKSNRMLADAVKKLVTALLVIEYKTIAGEAIDQKKFLKTMSEPLLALYSYLQKNRSRKFMKEFDTTLKLVIDLENYEKLPFNWFVNRVASSSLFVLPILLAYIWILNAILSFSQGEKALFISGPAVIILTLAALALIDNSKTRFDRRASINLARDLEKKYLPGK